MKFSEAWLRSWVNPNITTSELVEKLTMAGLEVDSVEPAAPEFAGVVVGKVLSVAPHPNADKLRLTKVDVGEAEPLDIVCGASNVREGMLVPTAVVGAVLPGDFKIKKSKLRGEPSLGMLCSAKEIGLAEEAEGLLELPGSAQIGQSIREFFGLDDQLIEVDLTPNRGDCLSIRGLAREVGVLTQTAVAEPEIKTVSASTDETFPVNVSNTGACPRYLGRVISGIDPSAETPMWMQERLRRSGIRSLGPLVDVTNYVLLELGQPMHAFDLSRLGGSIEVRNAKQGEQLTLLDGQEVKLNEETLVIADQEKVLAIAGVMGGEFSGVSDSTSKIFLECAYFSPEAIAGRARSYGLHTDSSHRFERGVDYALQHDAVERATQLLLEICGGNAGPITEVVDEQSLPQRKAVPLRLQRINQILGIDLSSSDVATILDGLGMQAEVVDQGWQVTAPTQRFDIEIEEDLIEEVGRIYGYDRLPGVYRNAASKLLPVTEKSVSVARFCDQLVDTGFQEVITYSFIDEALLRSLSPALAVSSKPLANPLSAELSIMRPSLLPGLIKTALYNQHRQQTRIRIFETGLRFLQEKERLIQKRSLAGLMSGTLMPVNWAAQAAPVDFYDAKGVVELLVALTGYAGEFVFEAAEEEMFHPGQCARILCKGEKIGVVGALHPAIIKEQNLPASTCCFELDIDSLSDARVPEFKVLSKFPSIRRDLAIVVAEDVHAGAIQACIQDAASGLLKELELFDVYRGKGVQEGHKSLALGLTLQDTSRTLVDEDVEKIIEQVLLRLDRDFGAQLRE